MKPSAFFLILLACLPALAEPRLYLSVNGARTATIWPGMPVLIEASATGLAPGDPFPGAVLSVTGSADPTATIPVRALDATRWVIEPAWTRDLAPGRYQAKLTGAATPVTLQIVSRPETPGRDEMWRETQWLAWFESRYGQLPAALDRVENWLKANPDDGRALAARAELLEQSGRTAEALIAWSRAIEAEEKWRSSAGARRESPGALYLRRDALLERLLRRE